MSAIKNIQARCRKNQGAYVHYSQSEEPTRTLINMLPYTSNGICQALSAKWIAEHANEGSLWNWLFAEGTTNVKQAAIANLMINFTESVVRTASNVPLALGNHRARQGVARRLANPTTRNKNTSGDYYQDFVTDKYLGLYGMKRRGIARAGYMGSMSNRINYGLGPRTGQILAATLQPKYLNTTANPGAYVLISVLGNGGHAMAAYVGTDVSFFDPNFGEFWFPKTLNFYNFFQDFWSLSGYDTAFDSFYLLSYGKKVG